MNPIAQTSLYYSEGRSDKEYHAEIVEVAGGHVVNFRFGRRGAALTVGTKTLTPLDFAQAKTIYDKLVKEKTAKGYTPEGSGAAYQGTAHAGRHTGFVPQLLNPIAERDALDLINDHQWAAQEKMDGERRAVHAEKDQVTGINRKGLIVPLPQMIANELQYIAASQGAIFVDGEMVGERLYVFDLHTHQGARIHASPWIERMRLAEELLSGCQHIRAVPFASTVSEKISLLNRVKIAHGEGLVFKRMTAPVTEGRPNSGGDWLKLKFVDSASCCVVGINSEKRSVRIGLVEIREGQEMLSVGNVTIPPNQTVPAVGEVVEVDYLYAYPGGSLYQPVYRGKRPDLDFNACTIGQLKYKPAGREDEDI
jgi:bifunctional non-homologous end joining protein LigD